MKIKLVVTLTAIAAITAGCGNNADSAINQTSVAETVSNSTELATNAMESAKENVPTTLPTKDLPTLKALAAIEEEPMSDATDTPENTTASTLDTLNEGDPEPTELTATSKEIPVETQLAQAAPKATPKATQTQNFIAGQHYDVLPQPIEMKSDKVQVSELFWYGCSHCFQLEPYMQKFRANLPKGSELVEVPAIFGSQWRFHAQAFYTAQALGIQEDIHQDIFNAIHLKKKRISTLAQLQDLFAKHGKDKKAVESAFKSFSVDSNLRNAALFAQKTGANSVPTLIIDGKYRTTVGKAGGYEELLTLLNHLVEKAQQERN